MVEERELRGVRAWLSAPQADVPWGWTQILVVLVVSALSMLMIASSVALSLDSAEDAGRTGSLLLGWLIGLLIMGAFVLVRWRRYPEHFAALRLIDSRLHPALMLMIGVGIGLSADVVAGLGSGTFGAVAPIRGLDLTRVGPLFLSALFLVLVQPLVEGLVFFGVLLPTLRKTIGPWPGLLTTALAFAGFHMAIYAAPLQGNFVVWYGFVLPLVVGFGLAAMRVWAASTRSAMIAYVGTGITLLLVSMAAA